MKKFFRRHQGRGSYDLFSNYNFYLPGVGGMLLLFVLFLVGAALGGLTVSLFQMFMSAEAAQEYGTIISYPIMFIPPMLYASAKSRSNEFIPWNKDDSEPAGVPLDSNNFGRLGGWKLGLVVSVATMAAAFISEPVNDLLPEMP